MLDEGTSAPDFELKDQDGKIHRLSEYIGQYVVLYFYPKDMTPGCTKEACSFRDDMQEYKSKGVKVIGVSTDGVDSHKKFADRHNLNFTLLSDPDKKVVNLYQVYGEKKFMGRTFMGIKRMTYLIDKDGMISKAFPKVDVKMHSKEILEELE